MMNWIISSTVLILAVMVLRLLLKGKISLKLQYALWALVLVRLLFPFSIGETAVSIGNWLDQLSQTKEVNEVYQFAQTELPSMSYRQAYEEVADKYQNQGIDISTIPEDEFAETINYEIKETMAGDWSLVEIAKVVWILGGVVVSSWFFITNFRFQKKLAVSRKSLKLGNESIASFTNEVLERCKDKVSIYISDEIDTPCLFGLFHPAIYITSEVVEDEAVLRHVLAHEITHYLHRDYIWGYIRVVCLTIHWFNPLVWCAAILSRNDAELACDEATIQRLGESERASYGRTLIGLTCEKRPDVLLTATTMTGSGKTIKERISMIVKKPKMALITLIVVIAVTIIAVLYTFTGGKQYASFEEWTSTLEAEDIQAATVSRGYDINGLGYIVPEEEYEGLCNLLKTITDEKCFRSKQEGNLTEDRLYIMREDKDWVFQCLDDGTIGVDVCGDEEEYFGMKGKRLIIESQELWDYIMETLEEKATSRVDSSTTEDETQIIEYSKLSRNMLVTDEDVVNRVLNLLLDEKELITKIESKCELDFEKEIDIEGITYYEVIETDSWDYYEDIARNYYSDDYLKTAFTERYTENLFVEKNGKLYRTPADGIVELILNDSIEVWQTVDKGIYYVTITAYMVGGGYYLDGYKIQLSENNIYGFEIVDKLLVQSELQEFEYLADLTHDGRNESVRVSIAGGNEQKDTKVKIRIYDGSLNTIYEEELLVHPNLGVSYHLVSYYGNYYLMYYKPSMNHDVASCVYEVFYLNNAGEKVILDSDEISISLLNTQELDKDAWKAFANQENMYFKGGFLLVSTNDAVLEYSTNTRKITYFENFSWLLKDESVKDVDTILERFMQVLVDNTTYTIEESEENTTYIIEE